MYNKIIPLLVDILAELTQIRLVLTDDFDPVAIAEGTVKIIESKNYLSDLIAGVEIKEVK